MGYTTIFGGSVAVDPPLNEAEVSYIEAFAATRHMDREQGPYFVDGSHGRDESGVRDSNRPDASQPGLWCQWVPTEEADGLEWDGGEKFYDAAEWMQYLIDHFLRPGAHAQGKPGFEEFSFDHVVDGTINAQGEEAEDIWRLAVVNNRVKRQEAQITYQTVKSPSAHLEW